VEAHLDPPQALARAVDDVIEPWLVRCVERTAQRQWGACPPDLLDAARRSASQVAPGVSQQLQQLLTTDVDDQRRNPLGVLRDAVVHATRVLAQAGVPPVRRDAFAEEAFPDDCYDLSPATWSDVDASLHEPGIVWGAWKAKVVLDRRRSEGRR
jgi:hypothetical protein